MNINVATIQETCCEFYGITRVDLVSARRTKAITYPRQVAMYLSKELTTHSMPSIGRLFGDRDHTTVLHAIRKVRKETMESIQSAMEIDNIMNLLHSALPQKQEDAMERLAKILAGHLRNQLELPEQDIEKIGQLSAAKTVVKEIQKQPADKQPIVAKIITAKWMHPDGPFCKAAAAVSIAALEAEQAKFTENEGFALQKMEKAAVAFAKEYQSIRHIIERKPS